MRPTHRCSHVTGGLSTNVSRMARAIGTRTACAQYRTTTTSTHPANVPHRLNVLDVSSMSEFQVCRRACTGGGAPTALPCVAKDGCRSYCGGLRRSRPRPGVDESMVGPAGSHSASVDESAAAEHQHHEQDDDQCVCVHFFSRYGALAVRFTPTPASRLTECTRASCSLLNKAIGALPAASGTVLF